MTADPTPADERGDRLETDRMPKPDMTGIERVGGDARGVFVGNRGPITYEEVVNWYFTPQRVRRGSVLLARADEGELLRLFVTPPGWDKAQQELMRDKTVMITGVPHTGRRTAGWCLLAASSDSESREVQTISPESDESEPPFDSEEIVAGDRLLVDLSTIDDTTFARAEDALGAYLAAVVDRQAMAVVLMPWDQRAVRSELRRRTRTVGRPDGFAVLRSHFAYLDLPVPDAEHSGLPDVVHGYGIGEIARLAELAAVAHQRASGPGWTWLDKAIAAVRNRDSDAERLVRCTAPDLETRALLMAVALFHGSFTETVTSAANRLLEVVLPERERTSAFAAPGLGERLGPLDAEIDGEGRIRFTGLDTAASVRAYFWTHFPDIREEFRDWALSCGPVLVEDGIDSPEIVRRLVEQLLRVRRRGDVFYITRKWAEGTRAVTVLASAALEHGLTDPRHGWAFRRQCYEWARAGATNRPAISSRLADLLVAACREVISSTHPEQATVRLRYLAAHRDERVASNAREALGAVVGQRPERLRHLLGCLDGGATRQQRRSDARSFLAAVDPSHLVRSSPTSTAALIDRRDVRSRLVERWRDAWLLGTDEWEAPLQRWLATAQDVADDRILAVVAAASDGRLDQVSNLEAAAERWAATQGGSAAYHLTARFVAALDDMFVDVALQSADLAPYTPSPGSHVSEEPS
ncbi:hypothetical protein [Pseudonocardia humida]|uniref:Uncharacterized protein n=1 Tax=Pseudonocardia humida TaxID=2800819 RepID=A0ABT1A3G5_9PSEU|nr:hypothetical protein [Pseudonocardia humida]MCO1657349.1 hypothetical protein [Pseudonocardia humida]